MTTPIPMVTVPTGYGQRECPLYSSFADLFKRQALCLQGRAAQGGTCTHNPDGTFFVTINTDFHPDNAEHREAMSSIRYINKETWCAYVEPTEQVVEFAGPRMIGRLGSLTLRYVPGATPMWVLYAHDTSGISAPAVAAIPGECELPDFPQFFHNKVRMTDL